MANHNTIETTLATNARMMPGTQTWWSSVSEFHSEMFDFMSHRFTKDSAALHQLSECRNWEEVASLHSTWLQDLSKDYSAEASKVMAIYTKKTANGAQDRRPRH